MPVPIRHCGWDLFVIEELDDSDQQGLRNSAEDIFASPLLSAFDS